MCRQAFITIWHRSSLQVSPELVTAFALTCLLGQDLPAQSPEADLNIACSAQHCTIRQASVKQHAPSNTTSVDNAKTALTDDDYSIMMEGTHDTGFEE